ncbi:hypothetical protein PInf_021365 [Phytophthora infestans]|nr:hypothetical protein PInf_021365 [Phytophthora infestans]
MNEEASETEDSGIAVKDLEERSEQVIYDELPVIEDRAKLGVNGSSFAANSADQHSRAETDYASREVLPLEGTKPNDDQGSALETLDDENRSDVVRQHDVDATYLGDTLEPAVDEEIAWQTVSRVSRAYSKTTTELVPAELIWDNDECCSTGDPMETLRLRYLAIAAIEDDQGSDVDVSEPDIF